MVLVIEGQPQKAAPRSILDVERTFPTLASRSKSFRQRAVVDQSSRKLLYVLQRESAVVSPSDDYVDVLGSEDATTCHILILRHAGSGAAGLCHLDGCDMSGAIGRSLAKIRAVSKGAPEGGRWEAHLFGGFIDDREESVKISKELFSIFHGLVEEIHLVTACVCDANDVVGADGIHRPAIYGVAIHCKSGEIFPATFDDKGPDIPLRSARHFSGTSRRRVIDIYDVGKGRLVLDPFDFDPWDEADLWLQQSDAFILKYLSTSPLQEPADFVSNIRRTLEFIVQNPTLRDRVFVDGAKRTYDKGEDGEWRKIEMAEATAVKVEVEKRSDDIKS